MPQSFAANGNDRQSAKSLQTGGLSAKCRPWVTWRDPVKRIPLSPPDFIFCFQQLIGAVIVAGATRRGTTRNSRRISLKTASKWLIFWHEFFKIPQELTVEPVLAIGMPRKSEAETGRGRPHTRPAHLAGDGTRRTPPHSSLNGPSDKPAAASAAAANNTHTWESRGLELWPPPGVASVDCESQ